MISKFGIPSSTSVSFKRTSIKIDESSSVAEKSSYAIGGVLMFVITDELHISSTAQPESDV